MVCDGEVDILGEILTEARWLRSVGESARNVELWMRASLQQRLPRFPLTTARELAEPVSSQVERVR